MNLKYRSHVYSEPVCLHITYQVRAWVHFINYVRKFILQRISQVRKCSGFPILMLKLKEEMHPCLQQTFRFIKNGHLQFFVCQKVWYIGVTKSIKLKNIFVRFLFYGYWKFVTFVKKDPKTRLRNY